MKVKPNNIYENKKCAAFDGLLKTSTYAEFIKLWTNYVDKVT